VSVVQRAGTRLIFLYLDIARDVSPFVTDKEGKPLSANPLKDVCVRQALSKAIDREAIRVNVMEGASRPSDQLLIPGLSGYSEAIKGSRVDVEGAKKLLAAAGYPNGFGLTIHGPNNRYVQDDQTLQALAQMFSRIGIATKVEAMPAAVFFPRNNKGELSVALSGWAPDTAEASSPLRALIATRNKDRGLGTFNSGGYSNAKVDQLIEAATATINDAQRDKLLQQATEAAMADYAIVPLHHQVNVWATRKNVRYTPRADERTYGFNFVLLP
jgi:peptide/nickel transport system substrate-binding protein